MADLPEVGVSPGPPTRKRIPVDPITLRVLGGAFDAIAQEMAGVLFRMSYSSIIRESEDLGAGIFDADGRELCESESTPMHIGSLPWYIRGFLRRIDKSQIKEGDVIIHNHPYLGASHTPDIAVAVPILWEGELIGFTAVTAHVLDVGGSYPGINADAFDMYAEAKIYNGLKWYEEGVLNEDLDRMVFDNVRTETMNRGDMNAMMAACILGRDRFYRLLEKHGADTVMSSAYDWMDYSERRLRSEIAKLPDGEYVAPTAWLDDDGRNRDVRLRVETKIIVKGDHVTIDLTGSNAEVPTGYNVPFEGSLLVAAYFAIRTLLLDQDRLEEQVPQNDGIFRCVDVIAPKGSIFNPNFPRACFSRFCQCQRVVDNTFVALSGVVPDLVTAGNSAALHFCSYAGFIPEKGEYWLYLEVNEGSYGGRKGRDAMDSVDCLMANTRNNPIEELDMRFPLRCERYELRADPAAPGQWRGGIGIVRVNRFLESGAYSCEGDRHSDPPRGIFGGYDGLPAKVSRLGADGSETEIPAKVTGYVLEPGEAIQLIEPNGGGYGNPLDRVPEMVREDVLDDFTTISLAREAYGVVIDEQTLAIDEAATASLRERLRAERGNDFQGELLTLVSTPHPLAVSPHR
jgi:N-methylhydantoinase B/oxoprolinase/acetone carboxylase alpha subunit